MSVLPLLGGTRMDNEASQLEQDTVTIINSLRRKGQQAFVITAEWKLIQNY